MLILLAGSILLCVGVSRLLDLSPLIASLAVGATMVNLSGRSRQLFETLAGTDPPFYAIFFVIAGADLDLALVPAMGVIGLVYVFGRSVGKFVGGVAGARWLQLEPAVQKFLGFGLLAQAGLAVGLTIAIEQRYETFSPIVSTVVLAAVAIFEMVGPISTRFALIRSGEAEAFGVR
jgi:Kef-type K+ transport system membrane component KefB